MAERLVRVRVTGRVQGVWFRAWTRETARALGLAGWARNEADGSVMTFLDGPAAAVDEMLRRMQDGPAAARVDAIVCDPADAAARAEPADLRWGSED